MYGSSARGIFSEELKEMKSGLPLGLNLNLVCTESSLCVMGMTLPFSG